MSMRPYWPRPPDPGIRADAGVPHPCELHVAGAGIDAWRQVRADAAAHLVQPAAYPVLTEASRSGILAILQSARPVPAKRATIIPTIRQRISMVSQQSSSPQARDSRLEREIERERKEHSLNQDAKTRLRLDEDERHKDARATSLSSKVRR